MPPLLTQEIFLGDSASIPIVLTDPVAGTPYNPGNSTLLFTCKRYPADLDAAAKIAKDSRIGGITIVTPASGWITVDLVPADRANLSADAVYHCDVQAQDNATGKIKTVARFKLVARSDVTIGTAIEITTYTTQPSALLNRVAAVPAASNSAGFANQYAFDADYLYICIATNTWRRMPLNDWA